jgi:hypothetical protein
MRMNRSRKGFGFENMLKRIRESLEDTRGLVQAGSPLALEFALFALLIITLYKMILAQLLN